MALQHTIPCDNMYDISYKEYVGDSYAHIIANFSCLESRDCNLIWSADFRWEPALSQIAENGAAWNKIYSDVQELSSRWATMTSLVHYTSAMWAGPITLVYPDVVPPHAGNEGTVINWLRINFPASDYTLGQTVFVYLPFYNQDPYFRNSTYNWTTGLALEPVYLDGMAVFMFASRKIGNRYNWVRVPATENADGTAKGVSQRILQSANTHDEFIRGQFPKQTCACWGEFEDWWNCCKKADLPAPYYELVDCAGVEPSCYIPAEAGQYDHYVGHVVRISSTDADFILSKSYPRVTPASEQLCPNLIITEACEATSCPDQCYSLTPIGSADSCTAITTHTTELQHYVGKYVKIEEQGVDFRTCYLVSIAPNCRCSIGVELVLNDFCFKLTDCAGCAAPIYTGSDMYDFVGRAVVIEGSPLKWSVEDVNCPNEPEECSQDKSEVTVLTVYDFCGAPCPCPPAVFIDPPIDIPISSIEASSEVDESESSSSMVVPPPIESSSSAGDIIP